MQTVEEFKRDLAKSIQNKKDSVEKYIEFTKDYINIVSLNRIFDKALEDGKTDFWVFLPIKFIDNEVEWYVAEKLFKHAKAELENLNYTVDEHYDRRETLTSSYLIVSCEPIEEHKQSCRGYRLDFPGFRSWENYERPKNVEEFRKYLFRKNSYWEYVKDLFGYTSEVRKEIKQL